MCIYNHHIPELLSICEAGPDFVGENKFRMRLIFYHTIETFSPENFHINEVNDFREGRYFSCTHDSYMPIKSLFK